MQESHRKILAVLRQVALSQNDLAEATGYSRDGIRGRISELRKEGYAIENIYGKYHLHSIDKIIYDWIEEKGLFNNPVSINRISTELKMDIEEVKKGISVLISKNNALQMPSNYVIIYKKNEIAD